jgi:hypothetical protein
VTATVLENNFCVIGSIISIFAGAIFLVSAWVYWSRSPAIAPTQHKTEEAKYR